MEVSKIDNRTMSKFRKKYWDRVHKSYNFEQYVAWLEGWNAAVRFLTKMEDKDTFCSHCGKPLSIEEANMFDDTVLCDKCNKQHFEK